MEKYRPTRGDLFEWCDEQFWCIESNTYSGVVNPIGETYYVRNFIWGYGGERPKFIRKGTEEELEKLGL